MPRERWGENRCFGVSAYGKDGAQNRHLRVLLGAPLLANLVPDVAAAELAADDGGDGAHRLHERLVLVGDDDRLELGHLGVEPLAEALLDVVDRRHRHVLLEVVQRLLRNVREP